ncbi:unnamed protein product [Taenia asiatica]|uniref:XPG_I_2 domain-containing protein n=1 Tax=Taenia asiatica TaxID=60517 RepID=A0A158R8B8_TAEAS|nr:unnamed protein product [Taenia asiatica]
MLPGLTSFVHRGAPRFETFEQVGAYGVDFLRAKVLLERVLKDILRCGVLPIFVFIGIIDSGFLVLESAANRHLKERRRYKEADLDVAATRCRSFRTFFPCARQFVTNCLRDMELPCVQLGCGCLSAYLGMAYYLDCPIASMSTHFYLLSHPSILPEELQMRVINEVKFVDLNTDFYRVDEEGGKAILKLKVFHPEASVLRRVPVTSRPLIALMLNSDLLRKLPTGIKVKPVELESYNSAKIRAVIDWVSNTDSVEILQAIVDLIKVSKCFDSISGKIVLFLEEFCPDFVEASQVLKVLGLDQGIPTLKEPIKSVEEVKMPKPQRSYSPLSLVRTLDIMLKGATLVDQNADFLYGWPVALIQLYRSNMLDELCIEPLYNDLGVLYACNNDYLIELPCVYGPGRILRYAHYCLIMGLEEANNLTFKLVGLRPHAKEVCYEGLFRYKTYMMEVKPMRLPRNCSVDDFIYDFIGLKCTLDVPDWSLALVISCALWHQQKEGHGNCDIADCPCILSVLVLAVATHYNMECSVLAVADHYDTLKSLALIKVEDSGASATPAVEKELIHNVSELMVVYGHYVSLCRLVTALQENSGTPDLSSAAYNRFPPSYEVFPSLALIVYMAAHLRCVKTPSAVATRLWMANAFLRTTNSEKDLERLSNAVTVFTTLLKFVSTLKLSFTAPNVDVTDPPSYFSPKEETPPPMGCVPSQDTEVPLKPSRSSDAALLLNKNQRTATAAAVEEAQEPGVTAPWTRDINSIAWIGNNQKSTHVIGVEIKSFLSTESLRQSFC